MDITEAEKYGGKRHPWELSRSHSLLEVIARYKQGGLFADIGAGDLFVAGRLLSMPGTKVQAVDSAFNAESAPAGCTLHKSIAELAAGSVDCALLFDVLEHIEHPESFMPEVAALLKPGGVAVITVPAWQFLFSDHDVFLKHFRRYNLEQAEALAAGAGLEVEESFYFYFTLFSARLLQKATGKLVRGMKPTTEGVSAWRYGEKHPLSRAITSVLNADFAICRFMARLKIRIPGLSLCMVCRKKSV